MANESLTSLPAHYERQLGEIVRGWSDEKQTHSIQVASFKGQPESGVTTFATLGLSRYVLDLSGTRKIRQELLILFFQRNHFLYHVDANTSFIFIICHNCITVKPYQTLLPKARIFDRICCFLSSGKFGLESNFRISASALEARALFSDAL